MRFIFSFAILAATCCSTTFAEGNNELFSEVAMESVFEKGSVKAAVNFATPSTATRVDRITGVSGLVQILNGAGLKSTVSSDRVKLVLEKSGWAFPVALEVDVEQERVLIEVSLVQIGKGQTLDQSATLKLLSSGNAARSAFFAFEPTEKLIQLRASMSTRNVSRASLMGELERLARFADERSKLWSGLAIDAKSAAASTTTAQTSAAQNSTTSTPAAKTPVPASPTKNSPSLQGQWSAGVTTGEAFAVVFDSSSRFALVHVKGGKTNTSKGTAIRNGDALVLQGDDGTKLNGKITWRGEKSFQLAITGADGKPSVSLEFKKNS